MITPILGVGVIALAWFYREFLARHARRIFWGGLGLLVVLSILIVLHGRHHNSLFIETLTFRWNYWVGSAHIVRDHPLLGVGLENFGLYYLAARLPHAAEEIKDPHNLVVRFAVELGIIGAMLCVTWLVWLAWQLTRPISPPAPSSAEPTTANQYNGLKTIALIAALGMLINGMPWAAISAMVLRPLY